MVMECKVTVRKSHYPKDVPFEVPEGWVWCSLKDVCTKIVDGDHNPPASEKGPTEYLMISSKNILDGNLANLKDVRYLSRSVFQSCNQRTDLQLGDILLTTVGTLGRSCIFQGGHKLTFQRSVSVISPLINVEYIKVFFDSEYYQRYIEDNARGTAQKGFYLNQLESSLIPVPPIAEQKRIVDKANLFLVLCQEIQKSEECIHADIEKAKASILVLATHGELVPQDPSEEPALDLLKRINPGFHCSHNLHYEDGVKKGWIKCHVSDAFEINPKVVGLDDEECAFVPMALVPGGYSNELRFERKQWSEIKNGFTRFADGDIGVAKISPCLENRKSVIFQGLPSGKGAGTTELIILRPVLVTAEYGLLFLKSRDFIAKCKGTYNGVVGQQRVDMSVIRGMYMNIPPIPEQHRIVQAVNSLMHHLDIIQRSNEL